ncbi:shikimate dehydrogenase [Anaerotaenia torta]|uniref:shikimate dehydrogenase family protein n=1 Tax=Anaerotaenia torta TaxID=433293 RepID=UPI003D1EDBF8
MGYSEYQLFKISDIYRIDGNRKDETMRYGLIGEKLGHSYSKLIHERIAEYTYDLIPLSKEEFADFMERKDFTAINVTIPYKQAVIPYLDELDPLAREIGAVNTIVKRGGRYIGYNTDFFGFQYMLEYYNIAINNRKCLVLGSGGTSRTVRAVLRHLGASQVLAVSRQRAEDTISYEDCLQNHPDAQVIVNTTPLGMYPKTEASPIDLVPFTQCTAVADAIFNPLETRLTMQAKELGMKGVTGLIMLVAQAKQAIEYFLDQKLEDSVIEDTYRYLLEALKLQ